ncbi:hypothetical protein M8998_09685 [Sphingobacterium sp. lm-10]|uniref:hypothetical protein n=1 Tax=Sphingobacterium sp. lm-10 TaxID=2944904 RepID=UPI0020221837|nr:hypothetical protein [Sphingobacterium sp. lm-10]MCL7988207.1 hypothetical protein [Sphingobacterium sp. lm-10]
MEDKLKKFVSENRGAFDNKQPSPLVWDRIKQELPKTEPIVAVKQMRSKRIWYAAAASIVAFLTVGGLVWRQLNIDDPLDKEAVRVAQVTEPAAKVSEPVKVDRPRMILHHDLSVNAGTGEGNKKTASLVADKGNKENDFNRKDAETMDPFEKSLALLDDESSAMNRMDGVLQLASLDQIPDAAMVKIQHLMNNDSNENIRLAAYDLFTEYASLDQKEQEIQDIFLQQNDPAMQMELMQAMVKTDSLQLNDETTRRLETIAQDPLAIDLVKEQAYAVLMKNW